MKRLCDNCGEENASLVWSGYTRPLPDVAPSYSQWDECYLCPDCYAESKFAEKEDRRRRYA